MVTSNTSGTPPKGAYARTAGASSSKTVVEKATDAVTGAAGSLIDAVKENPIKSAAIAAGVAGVGAVALANRSTIAEQAGALGDKASELGGKLSDQASSLGGKIGEQASALGDKVSDTYASATGGSSKSQQDFSEEALSLKQSGDPMLDDQSKAGSVSY